MAYTAYLQIGTRTHRTSIHQSLIGSPTDGQLSVDPRSDPRMDQYTTDGPVTARRTEGEPRVGQGAREAIPGPYLAGISIMDRYARLYHRCTAGHCLSVMVGTRRCRSVYGAVAARNGRYCTEVITEVQVYAVVGARSACRWSIGAGSGSTRIDV